MTEKNGSGKNTITAACDFCEKLFDMDKIKYEIAMEQLYDILCTECSSRLEHVMETESEIG